MEMLNEKELTLVNGGLPAGITYETKEERIEEYTRKWLAEETKRLQGLADIRVRAAEDALKAEMRLNKQGADIKEAMKAQREALGLN